MSGYVTALPCGDNEDGTVASAHSTTNREHKRIGYARQRLRSDGHFCAVNPGSSRCQTGALVRSGRDRMTVLRLMAVPGFVSCLHTDGCAARRCAHPGAEARDRRCAIARPPSWAATLNAAREESDPGGAGEVSRPPSKHSYHMALPYMSLS
jgi:hypothetical protein